MLWVVSTVQHARVRRLMTDQRKRLEPASMPELGARVLGHVRSPLVGGKSARRKGVPGNLEFVVLLAPEPGVEESPGNP